MRCASSDGHTEQSCDQKIRTHRNRLSCASPAAAEEAGGAQTRYSNALKLTSGKGRRDTYSHNARDGAKVERQVTSPVGTRKETTVFSVRQNLHSLGFPLTRCL